MGETVIVAGFHSRNDDWILPHKLRALSTFCDKINVMLDRSPLTEPLLRRFPKVEVRHWEPTADVVDVGPRGRLCEEGRLRQAVWDWCAESKPRWIILGDSDEVPTPDIAGWLTDEADEAVDLYYADWVNLYKGIGTAIGGQKSPWSFQRADSNKKGMVARWREGVTYRYDLAMQQHCRMEPNVLNKFRAVLDDKHRLLDCPKLIHHKWADWLRWTCTQEAGLAEFATFDRDAEIVPVPREWVWRWDADEVLRNLPDEVCVVGNGPLKGSGRVIDLHECVIRLNNWRTIGFEKDAGTKTDLWAVNCWDNLDRRAWTKDIVSIHTESEQPQRVQRWLATWPHTAVPNESWIDAARVLKKQNPSTGLALLNRLVHHGKRVDCYGFDGMRTGHYWNPAHRHDHGDETAALRALMRKGVRFL